jgi:opacity protein-like surface antigen
MRNSILAGTILILLSIASGAFAQGIYVGAGIGNTFFSSEFDDAVNQVQEISENSTAWKIFAGVQLQKFIGI